MIAVKLKVRVDRSWVQRIRSRCLHLPEGLPRAWWREDVLGRIRGMYEAGGATENTGRWVANAPRTIEEKGHDSPMLSRRWYASGAMVNQYRMQRMPSPPGSYSILMGNVATKRGVRYGELLHEGRPGGGTKPPIPPRPHIGWTIGDMRRIAARVGAWILYGGKS